VDEPDQFGKNLFYIYLERNDFPRCKQLLKRGSDINFRIIDNKTALHLAIENGLSEKTILFLLDLGANPHIEDKNRFDCCDKAKYKYHEIN